MLQIKNIRKKYVTGELVQTALDGVDLTLRDHEFVAILGPSGSGKTTLLNIIGGLDRYDSGNLIINGISTEKYSDRDWDSYRNHTIGFVFQSYNLIPHQTVLSNVELALTISGISRSERKKRAVKALEDVGLGNQLHKKPNQMSGGQMQRVAIARALVNNPDILLADEPTGALDSETSVQVMELLKDVAKDRLVVMVTHNPELAEEYANRIVRVRDGRIISDSNPYSVDNLSTQSPKHKNMGRSRMSYFTALSLSFNNLRTKIARTVLTSFAGSIGIIGIALILSLSTGFQKYIDQIQADTLSNYPLTIQSETADMTAGFMALGSMLGGNEDVAPGTVLEQQLITQMFAQVGSNDLGSFKQYLEDNYDQIGDAITSIKYSYATKPLIYAEDTSEKITQVNPGNLFSMITGSTMMSAYMDTDVFKEMLDNPDMLNAQYDVLQGRWPSAYNEMILVLNSPSQISDYVAYTLGLKDMDSLEKMIQLVLSGQTADEPGEPMEWTYDQLLSLRFRLVPASDKYRYNEEYGVWEDMSDDIDYMRSMIDDAPELKIVGIVCPKDGVTASILTHGVYYTSDLTRHVIEQANQSQIVAEQLDNMEVDVFTGKRFDDDTKEELNFEDMISIDAELLSSAFGVNISESAVLDMLEQYIGEIGGLVEADRATAQEAFLNVYRQLAQQMLQQYITENADPETGIAQMYLTDAQTVVDQYMAGDEAKKLLSSLTGKYSVTQDRLQKIYSPLLSTMLTGHIVSQLPQEDVPSVPEVTVPDMTLPDMTIPDVTLPDFTLPNITLPDITLPTLPGTDTDTAVSEQTPSLEDILSQLPSDPQEIVGAFRLEDIEGIVQEYASNPVVVGVGAVMSISMTEQITQNRMESMLASFGERIMRYIGNSMTINQEIIASAFQFKFDQEELMRLMQAFSGTNKERTAQNNLTSLGYAELENPSAMAIYLRDFASKERFMDFLDAYNLQMENSDQEDLVIRYTDVTGMMMSSVRTIIDSVSYVLIAFVAVSLVVSSIMIGIITYISVMERTKEIGVLRAIGASKRNISQVFNAETFIIGLCSGAMGVGITLLLILPINALIHSLTNNPDISAQLPVTGAIILVVLSVLLTLIGGLIPSKQAAKKDPVIALRSE